MGDGQEARTNGGACVLARLAHHQFISCVVPVSLLMPHLRFENGISSVRLDFCGGGRVVLILNQLPDPACDLADIPGIPGGRFGSQPAPTII